MRAVGRVASKDFLKWTQVEQVFEGEMPHLQIYCMPVFRYQGIYLGLPAIYNTETDRTHTELAWSPGYDSVASCVSQFATNSTRQRTR